MMKMAKKISVFFASLMLCIASFSVWADNNNDPLMMVQTVTSSTINAISVYKKQHPGVKQIPFQDMNAIVGAQLLPHVDVDRMLKTILARQCTYSTQGTCEPINLGNIESGLWGNLRQQFIYLLVNLYGTALSSADQYEITFNQNHRQKPVKPTQGAIMEVDSQVQLPNSEPITLVYQLEYSDGQWLMYDLSINGAISVVNNLRAQFSPTIQQKGLTGLVQMLKDHNQQMMNSGN